MMDCTQVRPLIPTYVDGELSEIQAGRLRKHLMDCAACRALAAEDKSFKHWFVPAEAPEVPADFAARVARRAFAGDTGERTVELTPAAPPAERETPILQFALKMTAMAAAVLMVVSIGIGMLNQPAAGVGIDAEQGESLEEHQVLERLDQLNEQASEEEDGESK